MGGYQSQSDGWGKFSNPESMGSIWALTREKMLNSTHGESGREIIGHFDRKNGTKIESLLWFLKRKEPERFLSPHPGSRS
jgi:hypothetical protein